MVEIFFEMIVDLQEWLNGEQFLSSFFNYVSHEF